MYNKQIDGKPVIDAKKKMTLVVTKDDIKRANTKKPGSCALAQSCLRKPGVKEVRIHLSRAYVATNNTNWQRYIVSPRLRSEIVAFDRGGSFAPGEYTLEKINPSKKLGADKRKRPNGPSGRKKRAYHVMTDVRNGPA